MDVTDINIITAEDLPLIGDININDYIYVQTKDNVTALLEFKNFIIDLENTTFQGSYLSMYNSLSALANNFQAYKNITNTAIASLTSSIDTTVTSLSSSIDTTVTSLSSSVNQITQEVNSKFVLGTYINEFEYTYTEDQQSFDVTFSAGADIPDTQNFNVKFFPASLSALRNPCYVEVVGFGGTLRNLRVNLKDPHDGESEYKIRICIEQKFVTPKKYEIWEGSTLISSSDASS